MWPRGSKRLLDEPKILRQAVCVLLKRTRFAAPAKQVSIGNEFFCCSHAHHISDMRFIAHQTQHLSDHLKQVVIGSDAIAFTKLFKRRLPSRRSASANGSMSSLFNDNGVIQYAA